MRGLVLGLGLNNNDRAASTVPEGALLDPDTGFTILDPDTGDAIVDPTD